MKKSAKKFGGNKKVRIFAARLRYNGTENKLFDNIERLSTSKYQNNKFER